MQVTAQRLAIMRAVSSLPHSTADQLTDEVRSVLGSISRQAVYDSLGVLVDKGLLRRIQPAGSAVRYEDRVGDNHHHLICRTCSTVFDIDCVVGATPCLTAGDDHGFDIDEAEVIHWGTCPRCQELAARTAAVTEAAENVPRSPPSGEATRRRRAVPPRPT
ncbi:MAG: Fur family transcriptional regulator [Ilumatobacter sp.]